MGANKTKQAVVAAGNIHKPNKSKTSAKEVAPMAIDLTAVVFGARRKPISKTAGNFCQ